MNEPSLYPAWLNHIELVGLFAIIVLTAKELLSIGLRRLFDRRQCDTCYPTKILSVELPLIQAKQAELREEKLPALMVDIESIKQGVENLNKQFTEFNERFKDFVEKMDKRE